MKCPRCGAKLKRERWRSVKNWETATCQNCGFQFDYDADQFQKRAISHLSPLTLMFKDDMEAAIMETLSDQLERGFYIYQDLDVVGHTPIHIDNEGEVELKLKDLPFLSTDFILISFHTHNGENGELSLRDVRTALALGEDLTCIGYFKDNKPHVSCWQVNVEQISETAWRNL